MIGINLTINKSEGFFVPFQDSISTMSPTYAINVDVGKRRLEDNFRCSFRILLNVYVNVTTDPNFMVGTLIAVDIETEVQLIGGH